MEDNGFFVYESHRLAEERQCPSGRTGTQGKKVGIFHQEETNPHIWEREA